MNRPLRSLAIVFALLAATLLLAGCGGAVSKKEYQKDVDKVMSQVDESGFDSSNPKAADLEKGAKSIQGAADELDDITPPDDVKDLHEDLVASVRELGDILADIAPILAKAEKDPASALKNTEELSKIQGRMTKTMAKLDKTIKGFEKKGYDTDTSK